VPFTTEFDSRPWRYVIDTTLCDKFCLKLATGQWFSSVSSAKQKKKIICNVVESGAKHQHHPFFGEK